MASADRLGTRAPWNIAALLALATIVACGGDTASAPEIGPPAKMEVVSGDSQHGVVGDELAQPVAVRVVDASGRPLRAVAVEFHVIAGGGKVASGTVSTDANGVAEDRWTLGTDAGVDQAVQASVRDAVGQPIVLATFHASAAPEEPATLALATPPSTMVRSGAAFADQPAVRLLDQYGNAVPKAGVAIAATIATGGDGVTLVGESSVTTGADGVATFHDLGLAGPAGRPQLTFAADGLTSTAPVAIDLVAGAPVSLAADGPVSFTGTAGTDLTTPPRVKIRDAQGNGVAGMTVLFATTATQGTVAPSSAVTTSDGVAALTRWTLPAKAGTYTIVATSPSLAGSSVTFSATAVAGQVASLVARSSTSITDTATARVQTSELPSVTAEDAAGNPVPGATITFAVGSEGGTVSLDGESDRASVGLTTNANGVATLGGWRLPSSAGSAHVVASSDAMQVTFAATVEAANPVSLVVAKQPATSAQSGVALASQPAVRLRDHYGNIVARSGVAISTSAGALYSVTAGGNAATDATGLASFTTLTITGPTGKTTLSFSSSGLEAAVSNAISIQGPQPPRTPYLQVVSGAGQSGQVGKPLADPLVARVVDSSGTPMSGIEVIWEGPGGGGTVSPASTTSDAAGLVQTTVTALPTQAGTYDAFARLAVDSTAIRLAHCRRR